MGHLDGTPVITGQTGLITDDQNLELASLRGLPQPRPRYPLGPVRGADLIVDEHEVIGDRLVAGSGILPALSYLDIDALVTFAAVVLRAFSGVDGGDHRFTSSHVRMASRAQK